MAAQDQSEELNSNVEVGSCNSSERINQDNSNQWKEIFRVRKPYIVTKQREKWSEEEHEKFLEAIKLYGRGWSKIEEHIGTKTAVQIRSHAQKFFNKVAREANNSSDGSIEGLVIPPPRPKRKPDHPYPRKSPVSNLSDMEKGSKSPTSVLSAFASEDQMNRSSSPNSCISDIQSIGGKNDYAISKQSLKEDDAAICSTPISSITLFGKLVLVSESHKQSSYRDDHRSMKDQESHYLGVKKSTLQTDSNHVDTDLSLGVCETSCNGSNVFSSVTEVPGSLDKNAEPISYSRKRLSSLEKQDSFYPANGFRPFKRCLSEREVTSSLTTEEHKSQRERVCS